MSPVSPPIIRPRRPVSLALACVLLSAGGAALAGAAEAKGGAPVGWVQAAQKHNGSAVAVAWRVGAEAPAGQGVQVELQLAGITDPQGATVRLSADAGLQLRGDGAEGAPLALQAGATRTLTLTATPQADGIYYVNVFTTQRGQTSVTSVPVRTVGAGEAAKGAGATGVVPQAHKTPAGERLLSMPVK